MDELNQIGKISANAFGDIIFWSLQGEFRKRLSVEGLSLRNGYYDKTWQDASFCLSSDTPKNIILVETGMDALALAGILKSQKIKAKIIALGRPISEATKASLRAEIGDASKIIVSINDPDLVKQLKGEVPKAEIYELVSPEQKWAVVSALIKQGQGKSKDVRNALQRIGKCFTGKEQNPVKRRT